jgi:2-iminobutanoate/2-iminopropanoate deaminase
MEKINAEGMTRLPAFSHAVAAGDYVHVSGTLGTLGDGMELVEGGTGAQTTQVIENLARILAASGLGLGDVVKANVYLADMSTFPEMNEAYIAEFGDSPPARITVGGVALALGAAVEIDCIAYRGG